MVHKNTLSSEQAPSKRLMSAAKAGGARCSKLFQEVFTMHSTPVMRGTGKAERMHEQPSTELCYEPL